jgi:hypothetical protein
MSKCLRCGAGAEWIKGNVRAEPAVIKANFRLAEPAEVRSRRETGIDLYVRLYTQEEIDEAEREAREIVSGFVPSAGPKP